MDARLFTSLVRNFAEAATQYGGRLELMHHAPKGALLVEAAAFGGKMDLDNFYNFYVDPKTWVAPGPTLQDTLWRR